MLDLIEKMASSGNKVLEAASNDLAKWSNLKHNKQDLELFLQFNLVHLKFKAKGRNEINNEYFEIVPSNVPIGHIVLHQVRPPRHANTAMTMNVINAIINVDRLFIYISTG